MKTVYISESALDAQFVYDHLEENGFKVFIAGLALSGAVGELPVNMGPEVKVLDDSDYLSARAMVEEYLESRNNLIEKHLNCPKCGEAIELGFNQCWKCGEVIQ
jgi:ribosomal protein S27AE